MNCMKCGREMKEDHVFCKRCLTDMENYPVKPNTVVQLPVRPAAPAVKKKTRRKRDLKPEEQVQNLRFAVRWLSMLLAAALLAFAFTAAVLVHLLNQQDAEDAVGKNYTTQESAPDI